MKHLISLLCLLTIACNNKETTNNTVEQQVEESFTENKNDTIVIDHCY
nr:hypothetical protein [uncultured Capnocytophaga sp.]